MGHLQVLLDLYLYKSGPLHDWLSLEEPGQPEPQELGLGLLQDRLRDWVPGPHEAEQADQADHPLQPPLIGMHVAHGGSLHAARPLASHATRAANSDSVTQKSLFGAKSETGPPQPAPGGIVPSRMRRIEHPALVSPPQE